MKLYKLPVILSVLAVLALNVKSNAQCSITAIASSTNIHCGDSVSLLAVAESACKPLVNNFNTGNIGTWMTTSGGHVVNNSDSSYFCFAPSSNAPYYFFMGANYDTPRSIESKNVDLTTCPNAGAAFCWEMRYSFQGQSGTCEGPDAVGEGVYLQYNAGSGWVQLAYYDPNGGNDPQLTNWNQYSVTLPPAAISTSTKFRFLQTKCSGIGFDTWAIDNVQIKSNLPGYKFDWLHDTLAASINPETPKISPHTNTTYTVIYSNKSIGGSDSCSATVAINVIKPGVTIASLSPVCVGGTATLTAVSPYQSTPPTTCGFATPSSYCNPATEESVDYKLGTGTIVNYYNSATANLFGDFGPTNSNSRMQVLYRATELAAAGLKPGRIRSISFDIATVEDAGAYSDFSIYIGCTPIDKFATSTSFVPLGSMNLVYGGTGKNQTISSGWNQFNFSNDFNWTGTNIVIQICWTVANSNVTLSAKTRDQNVGYTAAIQAVNNTFNYSPTVCQSATTFATSSLNRPNTIFGNCFPRLVDMTYNWTPSTGLSSSTVRNPTVTPTVNTTYIVSASPNYDIQCATTDSVVVTVDDVTASINPTYIALCKYTGTASAIITATGSSSAPYTGLHTFKNDADTTFFKDNDTNGISDTILVDGISPALLNTNPLISVCVDITSTNMANDVLKLTSPAGKEITLFNSANTGANMKNTCFISAGKNISNASAPYSDNFAPKDSFPVNGNVNGLWVLNVADVSKIVFGNAIGGKLNNWNITFHTDNNIMQYDWINNKTGLSSANIASPTVTPTASATYTVKVTDALGCTATAESHVAYCDNYSVNDSCERAINILPAQSPFQPCENPVSVSTNSATSSAVKSHCSGTDSDDDVWYSFTANDTLMAVKAYDYSSGISNFGASLFSDCAGAEDSLNCNTAATGDSIIFHNLVIGKQYYMEVFTTDSTATGTFSMCLYPLSKQLVGIKETSIANSLSIIPNPASGIININFIPGNSVFSLKLTDVNGKIIYTENGNSNTYSQSVDISALAQGVYFLQISSAKELITKKVVKY